MTPDELYSAFVAGFPRRKFTAGLLVAFIDFFTYLQVFGAGYSDLANVLENYPQRTKTASGGGANTLIVTDIDGTTKSLRPFYDSVQNYFRSDMERFDYPNCARIVSLWDPVKQRIAVSSFLYYAAHVEKNSSLVQRIRDFIANESPASVNSLAGNTATT